MSKPWFRFYDAMLDDPAVQRLNARAFKRAVYAAIEDGSGPCARHIRPGRDRPSGPVWVRLRRETFARDDYTCQYCGARAGRLECDHIVPVSRGGGNEPENLATACFSCNRSKRAKTVEEWRPAT